MHKIAHFWGAVENAVKKMHSASNPRLDPQHVNKGGETPKAMLKVRCGPPDVYGPYALTMQHHGNVRDRPFRWRMHGIGLAHLLLRALPVDRMNSATLELVCEQGVL